MSEETPISISADLQDNTNVMQDASFVSLPFQKSPGGSAIQSLKGTKISRDFETFDSISKYLRLCGIELIHILFSKASFGEDNTIFFICNSIYGDEICVFPPDNFSLKGGDLEISREKRNVRYVPDSTTQYFLDKVDANYPVGLLFVCNAGIQFFPKREDNFMSYIYKNYEVARRNFDLKKHHFKIIPTVAFSSLMPVDRLNTLQIALEKISIDDNYEPACQDFSKAVLDSPLAPLMSSEAEFTLLIPPYLPEDADFITLASHVIMGRHDYNKEGGGDFTLNAYTKTGKQVTMVYENNFLKSIKIDDETSVEIDDEKTSVSKYNGTILAIKDIMPRLEPEDELQISETSDIENIFTVFDLNRLALIIALARKKFDVEDQNELLKTVNNLNSLAEDVVLSVHKKIKREFEDYKDKMSTIQEKFYNKEISCVEPVCEDFRISRVETMVSNLKFRKSMETSGKLRFVLKELELFMLELYELQQEIEVDEPITEFVDLDDSE